MTTYESIIEKTKNLIKNFEELINAKNPRTENEIKEYFYNVANALETSRSIIEDIESLEKDKKTSGLKKVKDEQLKRFLKGMLEFFKKIANKYEKKAFDKDIFADVLTKYYLTKDENRVNKEFNDFKNNLKRLKKEIERTLNIEKIEAGTPKEVDVEYAIERLPDQWKKMLRERFKWLLDEERKKEKQNIILHELAKAYIDKFYRMKKEIKPLPKEISDDDKVQIFKNMLTIAESSEGQKLSIKRVSDEKKGKYGKQDVLKYLIDEFKNIIDPDLDGIIATALLLNSQGENFLMEIVRHLTKSKKPTAKIKYNEIKWEHIMNQVLPHIYFYIKGDKNIKIWRYGKNREKEPFQ